MVHKTLTVYQRTCSVRIPLISHNINYCKILYIQYTQLNSTRNFQIVSFSNPTSHDDPIQMFMSSDWRFNHGSFWLISTKNGITVKAAEVWWKLETIIHLFMALVCHVGIYFYFSGHSENSDLIYGFDLVDRGGRRSSETWLRGLILMLTWFEFFFETPYIYSCMGQGHSFR